MSMKKCVTHLEDIVGGVGEEVEGQHKASDHHNTNHNSCNSHCYIITSVGCLLRLEMYI